MRPVPRPSVLEKLIRELLPAVALAMVLPACQVLAAEKPAEGGAHKATSSTTFVAFEPFYSTVLDGEKARGLLMVEMGLDIPDAALRERVNLALPALRDAYVRLLSAYATTAIRPYRQPNVEDLANRMQAVTDKMLAKKDAAKVLMIQTAVRVSR